MPTPDSFNTTHKNPTVILIIIGVAIALVLGLIIWGIIRKREEPTGPRRLTEEEIRQALERTTAPSRDQTPEEEQEIKKALESLSAPARTQRTPSSSTSGTQRSQSYRPSVSKDVLDRLSAPAQ